MSLVTMLPITPGKHTPFVSLLTPLTSDFVARYSASRCSFLLNTHSGIANNDWLKNYGDYREELRAIAINHEISHDNEKVYHDFIDRQVGNLLSRGFITIRTEAISWCQCGRIEVPKILTGPMIKFNLGRVIFKKNDLLHCKICKHPLTTTMERGLWLNFPESRGVKVLPTFWIRELEENRYRLSQHGLNISRTHRNGQTVDVGKEKFNLDPDFRWMCFINFLAQKGEEVILIAGADSVRHVAKVLAVSDLFDSEKKITAVIHPLLQIKNYRSNLSTLNCNHFIKYAGKAKVARTFLALGLQDRRPFTLISSRELYLVQKSVFPKNPFSVTDKTPSTNEMPIEDFFNVIGRQTILGVMKILRSRFVSTFNKRYSIAWSIIAP